MLSKNTDKDISDEPTSSFLMSDSDTDETKRVLWAKKTESMLSFVGLSVGLGNLWRFPYLCMRNGGGAFLIPFLICLVTCGLPLFFLELSLGQFSGKDAMHTWEICPFFKGIGIGMVIATGVFCLYYNVIIAWIFFYIGNSFTSPLPWRSCDNPWNTQFCITSRQTDTQNNVSKFTNGSGSSIVELDNANITEYGSVNQSIKVMTVPKHKFVTSVEEFWDYKALDITPGIGSLGGIKWDMALCYLAASVLVFLCLVRGVRSIGKVVYVSALLPYILLTVILIRALLLPGSVNGILFFITPNFTKLGEVQVWIEAALQVFYSLCPAWGAIITMASCNKFSNNCYKDSIILTLVSEGTSIYGGFAIFVVLGFMAHEANLPVSSVVGSGPGLGFVVYPEALLQLPLPNLWAVLFFVMLLCVALDSQFANLEVVISAIKTHSSKLKKKNVLVSLIVCVVYYVIGLVLCSRSGMYVYQLLDWYVGISVPMFALLECLIIGWIYGAHRYSKDVEKVIKRPIPVFMRICLCFVTPLFIMVLLVFTLYSYQPPTYGDYEYPSYVNIIGWTIGVLPLIPVFVVACFTVKSGPGDTVLQKLRNSLKPSKKWKPVSPKHAKIVGSTSSVGIYDQLKLNVFGESTLCIRTSK